MHAHRLAFSASPPPPSDKHASSPDAPMPDAMLATLQEAYQAAYRDGDHAALGVSMRLNGVGGDVVVAPAIAADARGSEPAAAQEAAHEPTTAAIQQPTATAHEPITDGSVHRRPKLR